MAVPCSLTHVTCVDILSRIFPCRQDPDAAKALAEELFAEMRSGPIYGRTYLSTDDGKPLR
jgi:hypothetical protein